MTAQATMATAHVGATTAHPLPIRFQLLLAAQPLLQRAGLLPHVADAARWPVARRKAMVPNRWTSHPLPPGVRIQQQLIPARSGPLGVRVYRPGTDRPAPEHLVLYLHGGGWAFGSPPAADWLCSRLATQGRAAVVSVDYRLAPEAPFPAALEDCADALHWTVEHAPSLVAPDAPVTVMGDSAGGNLAAALSLLARDDGGPPIAQQVLIYPALDFTLRSPSVGLTRIGITRADYEVGVGLYLNGHDPSDPLASPLLANDLTGLPPALIQTADHDLLRDDGSRYAERLQAAGVPVRYSCYVGMPHGFYSTPRLCSCAHQGLAEIIGHLGVSHV